MRMLWPFNSNAWVCLVFFALLLVTISTINQSAILMMRQLPIDKNQAAHRSRQGNTTIPIEEILSVAIEDDSDNHESTNTEIITTTITHVYNIPLQPMHNVYSILNQSVGGTIMQDQNHLENPFRNCLPTVQFQLQLQTTIIQQINRSGVRIEYSIQTMTVKESQNYDRFHIDDNIIPKQLGGDEIYVEWVSSDDPKDMGIAMITDEKNGMYTLKFVRPPLLQAEYQERPTYDTNNTTGQLIIYYDYTCGIGSWFAPTKNHFRRAGEVHVSFRQSDLPRPYIHNFIPPNSDKINANSDNINDDNNNNQTNIDLSKYDMVVVHGDSLMMQMAQSFTKRTVFWDSKLRYQTNIQQCISNRNETMTAIEKFHRWYGSTVQQQQNVAVILGSAVWDAMRGCVRPDFVEHRHAIREYITTLQALYPDVDFYWKSPSALLLHRRAGLDDVLDNAVWLQNSRYISDGVIRQMYTVQKELMHELHIPFLDLFDAYYLSAPWTLPGDARHFQDSIASLLLSYYWPGLKRLIFN